MKKRQKKSKVRLVGCIKGQIRAPSKHKPFNCHQLEGMAPGGPLWHRLQQVVQLAPAAAVAGAHSAINHSAAWQWPFRVGNCSDIVSAGASEKIDFYWKNASRTTAGGSLGRRGHKWNQLRAAVAQIEMQLGQTLASPPLDRYRADRSA